MYNEFLHIKWWIIPSPTIHGVSRKTHKQKFHFTENPRRPRKKRNSLKNIKKIESIRRFLYRSRNEEVEKVFSIQTHVFTTSQCICKKRKQAHEQDRDKREIQLVVKHWWDRGEWVVVVCKEGFAVYTKRKWNGVGGFGMM